MTNEKRLAHINERWGNYDTKTYKGFSEMCLDFEWLLEQAENAEKYKKALIEISKSKSKNSSELKDLAKNTLIEKD